MERNALPFTLSVAYYPEHWPSSKWESDMRVMRACGVNAIRLYEFAWKRMEPQDGTFDFSWTEEVTRLARKHGLHMIICTPTEAAPAWLWNRHPETFHVDRDGHVLEGGSRRHSCVNNETFLQYSDRVTEAYAQYFSGVDNVMAWQLDNEAGCHVNVKCHCASCTKKFREWLRKKYDTVDALNEAWGLSFWSGEVNCFEEVHIHHKTPAPTSPGYELDFQRFSSDSWILFLKRQYDIIKKHSDRPITHNVTWYAEQIDLYQLGEVLDVVGIDVYQTNEPLISMIGELCYGIGHKPFWVMEMGTEHRRKVMEDKPVYGQASQAVTILRHMMNGASLCSLFRFRSSPSGCEMHTGFGGLLHHDDSLTQTALALKDRADLIQRLGQDLFVSEGPGGRARTEKEYTAAIVMDYEDYFSIYTMTGNFAHTKSKTDHFHDLLDWYVALEQNGRQTAIISGDDDFDKYPLLVLQNKWVMDAAWAMKLERYVESGGVLVASDRFGIHTLGGTRTCLPLPGYGQALFGVRYNEYYSPQDFGFTAKAAMGEEALHFSRHIAPLTVSDAKVLAVFSEGSLSGKAAMTQHAYGKGSAVFIGGLLERADLKKIVQAHWKLDSPVASNHEVEVIRRGDILAVFNNNAHPVDVTFCEPVDAYPEPSLERMAACTIPPMDCVVVKRRRHADSAAQQ